MVKKFRPGEYRDEYQEALNRIVQARIQGEEIKVMEMPKIEEIPDLMSALKQSIAAATRESAKRPD